MYRQKLLPHSFALLLTALCGSLLATLAGHTHLRADVPDSRDDFLFSQYAEDPQTLLEQARKVTPAEGEDLETLWQGISIRFGDDGRRTIRTRTLVRYLTQEGIRQRPTYRTNYTAWYQNKPDINVRVISPEGQIVTLDPSTLVDNPRGETSKNVFSDARLIQGPFPNLQVGCLVDELEVTTDTRPPFRSGISRRLLLADAYPIHQQAWHFDLPSSLEFKYEVKGIEAQESRSKKGGRARIEVLVDSLPKYEDAIPFLPPDVLPLPYLAYSTAPSWRAAASEYADIVDAQLASSDLEGMAREAIGDTRDRSEKIARLVAKIHELARYAGVEFGLAEIEPRTPSEVITRGYGDCKDKSTLLTGMLRAAGIEANVALLNVGVPIDTPEDIPGLGVFNHAIVYVPGEPALWIDPTAERVLPGKLPLPDQGRRALVAARSTRKPLVTPTTGSDVNRYEETRTFYLVDGGPCRVVETSMSYGALEQVVRESLGRLNANDMKKWAEQYVRATYDNAHLVRVELSPADDLDVPVKLTLELDDVALETTDPDLLTLGASPIGLLTFLPALLHPGPSSRDSHGEKGLDERVEDLYFPMRHRSKLESRLIPPKYFEAIDLPEPKTLEVGPVRIEQDFKVDESGAIIATFRLDSGNGRLTAEEARTLKKDLGELEVAQLKLAHSGARRMAENHYQEGLKIYLDAVAQEPDRPIHRARLVKALLGLGLGDWAREEARKFVDSNPESAKGYKILGYALEHDLVGREYEPGYDHKGAIEAYKKAIELDPEDAEARHERVTLMTWDSKGETLPSKELEPAIEAYLAIPKADREKGVSHNALLVALSNARDYRGLLKMVSEAPEGSAERFRVEATAVLEGAEAASRVMQGLLESGDSDASFHGILAVSNLETARYYSEARSVLETYVKVAGENRFTRAFQKGLEEMVRIEEISFEPDDPRWPIVKAAQLFAEEGAAPKRREVLSYFAKSSRAELEERLDDGLELHRLVFPGTNLTPSNLDALFYNLQIVGGDDSVGYRIVNAPTSGFKDRTALPWYVVKVKGDYRIRSSPAVPMAGAEIVAAVDEGRLEAARQWLDWELEDATKPRKEDPLAYSPIYGLWKTGAEAAPDAMRVAGASVMTTEYAAEQAIPILVEAKEKEEDTRRKTAIDLALMAAYEDGDQFGELRSVAEGLSQMYPTSVIVFHYLMSALTGLDQEDELIKAAEARARLLPGDTYAMGTLANRALKQGELQKAEDYLLEVIEAGQGSSTTYNNFAWDGLFHASTDSRYLEAAEKAVQMTQSHDPAALHTLASLYAERGRASEAVDTLHEAISARKSNSIEDVDWFVVGRIAEHCGRPEVAETLYRKIPRPEPLGASATFLLAEKRLKAIAEGESTSSP